MANLSARDDARVRELVRSLGTLTLGAAPALAALVGELRDLLAAEKTAAYRVSESPAGRSVDFCYSAGAGPQKQVQRELEAFLATAPPRWALYNPTRPEPRQRNVVMRAEDLATPEALRRVAIAREIYPKLGLDKRDQLRVLLCEGPVLLAWVGGFRPDRFGVREERILGALVPGLSRRLSLERRLAASQLSQASLEVALEALPTAAYVVAQNGSIAYANRLGMARAERDPAGLLAELRRSLEAAPDAATGFRVARLTARGLPDHALCIEKPPPANAQPRLEQAIRRWQLTPRQAEVLAFVVRGATNKAIAVELDCSSNTVEVHVSSLLAKVGAGSRAELVARFWSDG